MGGFVESRLFELEYGYGSGREFGVKNLYWEFYRIGTASLF